MRVHDIPYCDLAGPDGKILDEYATVYFYCIVCSSYIVYIVS